MKKKLIALVTAITLCAVVVVGGTLAYFSFTTEEKVNTFTYDSDGGGGGIDIEEPGWDKDKDFTPNMDMAKDPYVVSTGGNDKYWTAMTITGASDETAFNTLNKLLAVSNLTVDPKVVGGPLVSINGLDTTKFNYTVDGDGTIYAYFQTPIFGLDHDDVDVGTNDRSASAFKSVKIQSQDVLEAILEKNQGTFPSFDIVVKGYAVAMTNDTVIKEYDNDGKAVYADFDSCEEAMAHAFADVFADSNKTYTPIPAGTTSWTGQ